jgi:hypothetical protein
VSSANLLLDERDARPLRQGPDARVVRAFVFAAAVLGTIVAVTAAVVAGTGWLYLMRHTSVLAVGPSFRGALPLQQLAGGSAQPLGRMAAAWIPAGLALGMSLAWITGLPRWARAAIAALGAIVLLPPASVVSDAIAQNEPLASHIRGGATRPGVWLAIALLVAGVLAAPPWRTRGGDAP